VKPLNLQAIYDAHKWEDGLEEAAARYQGVPPALYSAVSVLANSDHDQPLLAIAHLAYGWMPRMFGKLESRFSAEHQKKIVSAARDINSVRCAHGWLTGRNCHLHPSGCKKIQPIVRRSWVATSKILHFLSPDAFPIWDSVVAGAFEIPKQKAESRENFVSYVEYVANYIETGDLACVEGFSAIYKKKIGHTPTQARAIEYLLYCHQKGLKSKSA
jgi:hypothetical protein